jgi:hypothetical protein
MYDSQETNFKLLQALQQSDQKYKLLVNTESHAYKELANKALQGTTPPTPPTPPEYAVKHH